MGRLVRWRRIVRAPVGALLGGSFAAIGIAAGGPARPAQAALAARPSYVDCGAVGGGDGSHRHPFDSLADANAVVLAPGDRLLFRRGSVCTGTLAPQGAGAADRPAVIGAYGLGAPPRIVGDGDDAVLLRNTSHVVLQGLDVSNPGDTESRRRGVHVVADGTLVQDVTVRNLSIHDVDGDLSKDSGGSGGIQVDASSGGRFDGLRLLSNRIENVSRSGIFIVGASGGSRPRAGQPWPEASTGVLVRGNRLAHLAGDGIVSTGTDGAVLEHNVVVDGNRAGTPWQGSNPVCNAGIWTFGANSTLIQYNEVSDMEFNGCDGTGYDIDYNQDGTVVQYNYSHDNAGGFILLCTDAEPRAAEVRYNLSIDDAATLSNAPCAIESGNFGSLDGLRFYNNTFVAAKPIATLELFPIPRLILPGNFQFKNNILVATEPQSDHVACGQDCTDNLFFQLPPSGTDAVVGDPLFVDPSRRGAGRLRVGRAFRLRPGSPAIGAGASLADAPSRDYFGDPVPTDEPPSIGIHQPRWGEPPGAPGE
jgi:hypothetical protein